MGKINLSPFFYIFLIDALAPEDIIKTEGKKDYYNAPRQNQEYYPAFIHALFPCFSLIPRDFDKTGQEKK